jgi:hypothetical protein
VAKSCFGAALPTSRRKGEEGLMAHDATESDLARLLAWRPRPPSDVEPPPTARPDAATVGALLDDLSELRLGLSTDMGLLASAVEMQAYDIAGEVVDGGREDLGAFASRATARLRPDPAGGAIPPRRRSRLLRSALPIAPALAAAAALVGVLAGLAPTSSTPPAGPTSLDAAAASYAELYRLHERGAAESTLRRAAHGLHAEVARVMALAASDPAAAEQALRLLATEVTVVEDDDQRADLRSVLAESQRLLAVLEAAVAGVSAVSEGDVGQGPAQVVPTPHLLPTPAPSTGRSELPEPEPRSPAPTPSEEPSPSDQPAPEPTPSPTSSPTGPGLFPPDGVTAGTGSVVPGAVTSGD